MRVHCAREQYPCLTSTRLLISWLGCEALGIACNGGYDVHEEELTMADRLRSHLAVHTTWDIRAKGSRTSLTAGVVQKYLTNEHDKYVS